MEIIVNEQWLQAYLLVLVRITLFVAIAPPFSTPAFPWRIKSIVAAGLALAFVRRVEIPEGGLDTLGLLLAGTAEAATGAVLGTLVMIIFAAIPTAGSVIDLASGFQMASAYDPNSMVNGAQFTRLFQNGALALMFASGAYIPIFLGLATSYSAISLGVVPAIPNPAAAVGLVVVGMFAAALQIAAPLVAVLFLADAGLGLLTRVAPTLNVFTLGFPLKIMVALSFGGMVFTALPLAIGQLTESAVQVLQEVSAP